MKNALLENSNVYRTPRDLSVFIHRREQFGTGSGEPWPIQNTVVQSMRRRRSPGFEGVCSWCCGNGVVITAHNVRFGTIITRYYDARSWMACNYFPLKNHACVCSASQRNGIGDEDDRRGGGAALCIRVNFGPFREFRVTIPPLFFVRIQTGCSGHVNERAGSRVRFFGHAQFVWPPLIAQIKSVNRLTWVSVAAVP